MSHLWCRPCKFLSAINLSHILESSESLRFDLQNTIFLGWSVSFLSVLTLPFIKISTDDYESPLQLIVLVPSVAVSETMAFFTGLSCQSCANPQLGGPVGHSSSELYPLTCLTWVALPMIDSSGRGGDTSVEALTIECASWEHSMESTKYAKQYGTERNYSFPSFLKLRKCFMSDWRIHPGRITFFYDTMSWFKYLNTFMVHCRCNFL